MLSSVHIENIALIKALDINFSDGFTAFTGETGAGKSIVIDSIGMAIGAKVSKDIIRAGESEARVEALFSDVNPVPVKEALNMLGKNFGPYRLPLGPMEESKKESLHKVLEHYEIV